jgi:hypothetical protein
LGEVHEEYKDMYGKTLTDDIRDHCSDDYQKLMLTLVGEP